MAKPIEITRIFGHLDRDPMAVASVLMRMTPREAGELMLAEVRWAEAIQHAYCARVEAGRDGE